MRNEKKKKKKNDVRVWGDEKVPIDDIIILLRFLEPTP
jgi:hypothetical protein